MTHQYKFMGYCAICGRPVYDTHDKSINCKCFNGMATAMSTREDYISLVHVHARLHNSMRNYGSDRS